MIINLLRFNQSGLRDWIAQRVSAIILLAYGLCVMGYLCMHAPLTFSAWKAFMTARIMRDFGLLALLSLVVHAWIGVWVVLTDYIKCSVLRLGLQVLVLLALLLYVVWGIEILWALN